MTNQFNDLIPTTAVQSASPFHVVAWVEVAIDTNPVSKEVYPQGQSGYGDNAVKFYALTNVALARLMNAAGIKQTGSVRVDDATHPHICSWQFSAEYTQPDSTVLSYSADYELDLRDYINIGTQSVKGARFEKALQDERVAVLKSELNSKLWGDALNKQADAAYAAMDESNRKRVDELAEAKALRYIVQMRQFIVQRAQTGAMERVIRKMLNLKSAYSLEELKSPFRVPRARFDWDRLDSAIGKDAGQEMKQLQALKLLGIAPEEFSQWRQLNAPKPTNGHEQIVEAEVRDIPPSPPAPDIVSVVTPTPKGESSSKAIDMVAPVKRPFFRFTHRGQTEKVEYDDPNAVIAEALGKDPLKAWFGSVIVKSFGADAHYRNHLDAHFHVKSAASLTWKMLECLADNVNGVEYPKEYNPTPKKEAKPKSESAVIDPAMVEFVKEMCLKLKVKELPAQALAEATTAVKQGMFSLSDKADRDAIELTISEALPK